MKRIQPSKIETTKYRGSFERNSNVRSFILKLWNLFSGPNEVRRNENTTQNEN